MRDGHRTRRVARWLVPLLLAAATAAYGCSAETRYRLLSTLFEGVPKPGEKAEPKPVAYRPRRVPPKPPKPPEPPSVPAVSPAMVEPAGPPPSIALVRSRFPTLGNGEVDWTAALERKLFHPRPGIDPNAEEQEVLEAEVERVPETRPLFKALFHHRAHTAIVACESCHDGLFEMAAGATPMSKARILAGESCGVCHGPVAFPADAACSRCHPVMAREPKPVPQTDRTRGILALSSFEAVSAALPKDDEGGIDWGKALAEGAIAPRAGPGGAARGYPVIDLDVDMVPEGQEEMKAVFPHGAHTQWLACESCHAEGFFQKPAAAEPITMEAIAAGGACGRCHGSVAFPADTACERCHPAMGGG